MSEIRKMEEVTGTKERNQKIDIAVRNNGDQASCKITRMSDLKLSFDVHHLTDYISFLNVLDCSKSALDLFVLAVQTYFFQSNRKGFVFTLEPYC